MDTDSIKEKMENIGTIIFEMGFDAEMIETDEALQEIYDRLEIIEEKCKEVFNLAVVVSDAEHEDDPPQEDYLPTKGEENE